jgi:hypothetical protein
LPLLRLYQLEQPHRRRFETLRLAGAWLQARSPYATLRMLAITLRDLNVEISIVQQTAEDGWWDRAPSEERDRTLTREREAIERAEELLLAAFVLLRRLADQIADATRPLLFSDWQSAPQKMSRAIAAARTASLAKLHPLCDLGLLEQALVGQTQWFEALRQEEGIRDILVHKDHTFSVSALGTRDPGDAHIAWKVTADVRRLQGGKVWHLDALPAMHECMRGLCEFMETICRSIPGKLVTPMPMFSSSLAVTLT